MTQIRRIEANTKKHRQEVLTTTNVIQDAIEKNNVIFSKKWEAMHDCIDHHSEETCLLKNQVVDLEALSGLQQTTLQSCQNTIAGLEETVVIGHYFCSYFSSIFNPTSLHIPYPTPFSLMSISAMFTSYMLYAFMLTNRRQEHDSIGTTGH